jgi:hypothetical protein
MLFFIPVLMLFSIPVLTLFLLPVPLHVPTKTKSDGNTNKDDKEEREDEDFFKKQARLQQEAKIALAQV